MNNHFGRRLAQKDAAAADARRVAVTETQAYIAQRDASARIALEQKEDRVKAVEQQEHKTLQEFMQRCDQIHKQEVDTVNRTEAAYDARSKELEANMQRQAEQYRDAIDRASHDRVDRVRAEFTQAQHESERLREAAPHAVARTRPARVRGDSPPTISSIEITNS